MPRRSAAILDRTKPLCVERAGGSSPGCNPQSRTCIRHDQATETGQTARSSRAEHTSRLRVRCEKEASLAYDQTPKTTALNTGLVPFAFSRSTMALANGL